MDYEYQYISPEERAARRRQREAARKARKRAKRIRMLKRNLPALLILLAVVTVVAVRGFGGASEEEEKPQPDMPAAAPVEVIPEEPQGPYVPETAADAVALGEEIGSQYAVVLDLSRDAIIAGKGADTVISPASMTKILTLLVAAEQVEDLEDTFTITIDITDYSYVNECSVAGFELGETVTIRDLCYATILPSGADGALGLAHYIAGSQEAFVELMNAKLAELGVADTAHFTNCVGIYNEEHHCTVTDMALILKAAMENDFCRQVLSARTYTTSATEHNPEGLLLSNWFLRRIEDKDQEAMEVLGGKTGYVVESGSCAASMAVSPEGREVICVTADGTGSWPCIYDHVALYEKFA